MKNGFTLIELLAVIVILSLIATISIITVGDSIENTKETLSEQQIINIENRAKEYYLKEGMNKEVIVDGKMTTCVNVSYLKGAGFIKDEDIIDPKTKEIMNGSVIIKFEFNQYTYTYQGVPCSESE